MSGTEHLFKIREELPGRSRLLLGLACVFLVLLAWTIATSGPPEQRRISPLILPSPSDVFKALETLHWKHALVLNALRSIKRVTLGFMIAMAVAIPIGILMGAFPKVSAFLEPLVLFGGYIPIVTLIPLTIAWFGVDEAQKIGFLAIGIVLFLLPMVVKSIQDVDEVYLQTGYTLGADRYQTIRYVLVPVALSRIYNHCRFLYGLGWTFIILAEYTDLSTGLGAMIAKANRRAKTDEVFATLLVIIVIAILADTILKHIGYMLFPYEEAE